MRQNGVRDLAPIIRRDEVGDIILDMDGNRYVVMGVGMKYLSVRPEQGTHKSLLKTTDRFQTGEKVKV